MSAGGLPAQISRSVRCPKLRGNKLSASGRRTMLRDFTRSWVGSLASTFANAVDAAALRLGSMDGGLVAMEASLMGEHRSAFGRANPEKIDWGTLPSGGCGGRLWRPERRRRYRQPLQEITRNAGPPLPLRRGQLAFADVQACGAAVDEQNPKRAREWRIGKSHSTVGGLCGAIGWTSHRNLTTTGVVQ